MHYIKTKTIVLLLITTFSTSSFWFNFISLQNLLVKNSLIQYQLCFDATPFNFKPFPLSIDISKHPNSGYMMPTFILTIPQGVVQSDRGDVLIENQFIEEMIWCGNYGVLQSIEQIPLQEKITVDGRIAVITQFPYFNYFHWLTEVLGRLALLEMHHVEYDWLYVPQSSAYMRDSLELWGISPEKILVPSSSKCMIEACELILPSLVSNSIYGITLFTHYVHPHLVTYIRNKLLSAAQKKNLVPLSKKVFVSRKDAPFRKIINEDEIFAPLQDQGFERYELSLLSVAEQIMLFHEADIIIAPQGTCLANCIFCDKKTKIIELFQGLNDCTFWYVSQMLDLDYTPIATIDFIPDYTTAWLSDTYMPISVIHELINKINNPKA
jgi:hypothetical protein